MNYKNKICFFFVCTALSLTLTACGHEKEKGIQPGTYICASEIGGQIILNEDSTLIIQNFDFSILEQDVYETYAIAQAEQELPEGETLSEEKIQEIRDSINMNSQFLNKENTYTIESEDGCIGLYIPVDGSELFVYLQYYPSDNTLSMYGQLYTLLTE